MCGRYSNTGTKADQFHVRMAELLGVPAPDFDEGFERFNIAPTQEVAAAVDDTDGRRIELLRWGLLRGCAQEAKPGFPMINARAETARERPTYRDLIERSQRRCLVLADGWYEWQKPEDPRQPRRPVRFSLKEGVPFGFAGLWMPGPQASCTIVTCAANDLARPIHDRMPVVLAEPASWHAWLDPALDGAAACELLTPVSSDTLAVRRVSSAVNSVRNDGPECLGSADREDLQLQLS